MSINKQVSNSSEKKTASGRQRAAQGLTEQNTSILKDALLPPPNAQATESSAQCAHAHTGARGFELTSG